MFATSRLFLLTTGLMLIGQTLGSAAGPKTAMSAVADLDGDGRAEHMSLAPSAKYCDGGKLRVGSAEIAVRAELPESIRVVDIDRRDHFEEIEVQCGNPGDGGFSLIYGFDGKQINEMGEVGSCPEFTGTGIVYGGSWTGHFMIRHKFALDNKSRKLKEVRQPMYYVGKSFEGESSFPIRSSMDDASVVANVQPKSRILIIAVAFKPIKQKTDVPGKYETYEQDWYLIKTQSGLMGWASSETVQEHVPSVPAAG